MKKLKRITQIPFEGGSGNVPTGAMQFQHDWPGLFIRGDDAIALLVKFRMAIELLKDSRDPRIFTCLSEMEKLADIIDRDVVVKRDE